MFKKGDIIISTKELNLKTISDDMYHVDAYREYKVDLVRYEFVFLDGVHGVFPKRFFISLQEYRKIKMSKIEEHVKKR